LPFARPRTADDCLSQSLTQLLSAVGRSDGRTSSEGRRTTNDERRTTNDGRRTTDDQRPTTNDKTTNDQRRMTNDERQHAMASPNPKLYTLYSPICCSRVDVSSTLPSLTTRALRRANATIHVQTPTGQPVQTTRGITRLGVHRRCRAWNQQTQTIERSGREWTTRGEYVVTTCPPNATSSSQDNIPKQNVEHISAVGWRVVPLRSRPTLRRCCPALHAAPLRLLPQSAPRSALWCARCHNRICAARSATAAAECFPMPSPACSRSTHSRKGLTPSNCQIPSTLTGSGQLQEKRHQRANFWTRAWPTFQEKNWQCKS